MADVTPVVRGTFSDTGSNEAATLLTGADTAVGDVLVAFHANDWSTGSEMGAPVGTAGTWTEMWTPTLSDLGTNLPHLKAWWRRVTVAGQQRVTANPGTDTDVALVVVVLNGTTVSATAPIDAATGYKSSAAATAHTTPAVTMVGDRDRLLTVVVSGLNSSTATPIDYAPVSPMTELREIDSAAWVTMAVGTLAFTGAGSTGIRTFTSSVSRYWASGAIAIRGGIAANPKTIDLVPMRVTATTQAGVDYVKTGQTRDLAAVRLRHLVQRPGVIERAVDLHPVDAQHRWQRPVIDRGVPMTGGPLQVRFTFPEVTITNLTVTPLRLRVGVIQQPDNVEIVSVTPLTDRTQRPTSQAYVRPRKDLRFLVQEVLSRRWVSWDFGLREPEVTWNINASNEIVGKVDASELRRLGIDEWSHYLHVEQHGEIRNSGLILPWTPGGSEITITAAGVTRYPQGLPYQGNFTLGNPVGVAIDPLDVVRHCWSHIQSYPNGRLGVMLSSTTSPVRIGEPEKTTEFTANAGTSTEEDVSFTSGPYLLKWYEDTDIGKEIDDLAKETPFDYREAPRWNTARNDVEQWIELGYPRLGRGQPDIAFAQGQNLIEALAPVEDDDRYADTVIVLGKGEGTARVRGLATSVVPKRVRRAAIVEVKNADTTSRANALATDDLAKRHGLLEVDHVSLLGTHRLAPFGSFAAGDDVPVRMTVEGIGPVVIRHRVTGYTWKPEVSEIIAKTKRSDSFSYSGTEV